jgi:putative ABC transport system permease protein
MVLALAFTAFLTTQLPSVLLGILQRTYSFITDVGVGDIWVMDPKVQYVDDVKPMRDTELYRVRGVEGVEWTAHFRTASSSGSTTPRSWVAPPT